MEFYPLFSFPLRKKQGFARLNLAEQEGFAQVVPTARRERCVVKIEQLPIRRPRPIEPAWNGPTGHPAGADPDSAPPGGYATCRRNRARVRVGKNTSARLYVTKRLPSGRHAFWPLLRCSAPLAPLACQERHRADGQVVDQ